MNSKLLNVWVSSIFLYCAFNSLDRCVVMRLSVELELSQPQQGFSSRQFMKSYRSL